MAQLSVSLDREVREVQKTVRTAFLVPEDHWVVANIKAVKDEYQKRRPKKGAHPMGAEYTVLIPVLVENVLEKVAELWSDEWTNFYPSGKGIVDHRAAVVQIAAQQARGGDNFFTYCKMKPSTEKRWLVVIAPADRRLLLPIPFHTKLIHDWTVDLLTQFVAADIQPKASLTRKVEKLLKAGR